MGSMSGNLPEDSIKPLKKILSSQINCGQHRVGEASAQVLPARCDALLLYESENLLEDCFLLQVVRVSMAAVGDVPSLLRTAFDLCCTPLAALYAELSEHAPAAPPRCEEIPVQTPKRHIFRRIPLDELWSDSPLAQFGLGTAGVLLLTTGAMAPELWHHCSQVWQGISRTLPPSKSEEQRRRLLGSTQPCHLQSACGCAKVSAAAPAHLFHPPHPYPRTPVGTTGTQGLS